jgi:phage terminase large subunit-like protein
MEEQVSLAQILANLPEEERAEALSKLSKATLAALKYDWNFWARPNQLEPEGDWTTWLILAGRGFGKTRTGAETIRKWACGDTPLSGGRCSRIALVAETAPDARDVMVEGPAGILACHSKDFRPTYYPSKRMVEWPNGATALMFNAVEPDQLRGPQFDAAWCDELAKWRYAGQTFDQLQFGLRLGEHPRQIITTTPRPIPVVRRLMVDPDTIVTRGRTFDNASNLAAPFLKQVEERYGGTRLGRQELEGEILDDIPGALWNREILDVARLKEVPYDLSRVVVAVDPAATSGEDADETGIIGAGVAVDVDGVTKGYVLADRSLRGTPEEWAKKAVQLYRELSADRIIAEKNNGGEMVEACIKAVDRTVPVTLVHASRGKVVRAEPVSALYEQGRVHHVGRFDKLEDQMCLFAQDMPRNEGSPDRVDALVWAMTSLFDKIVSRRKNKKDGEITEGFKTQYDSRQRHRDHPNIWMA